YAKPHSTSRSVAHIPFRRQSAQRAQDRISAGISCLARGTNDVERDRGGGRLAATLTAGGPENAHFRGALDRRPGVLIPALGRRAGDSREQLVVERVEHAEANPCARRSDDTEATWSGTSVVPSIRSSYTPRQQWGGASGRNECLDPAILPL